MKFRDYFSNTFETSDNHYIPTLRTRYYRNRLDDVKNVIIALVSENKGKVLAIDDTFNEILFDVDNYNCTATFIPITPSEISIDLQVMTYSLIPLGKGKKIIENIYQQLDSKLQFKGVGLFKDRQ